VRGDGQTYAFRLRMTGRFDGVSYQVKFRAPEEWETVRFRFDEFEPVFRGRRVRGAPDLDPGEIRAFGFLISDGQQGAFRLEVATVEAVQERSPESPRPGRSR
jgi:monofunctional biosynthetic peptidoglycan transglycosylase